MFSPQDTKAEPGMIRNAASDLQRVAGQITGQGDALNATLRTVSTSFSDYIAERIRTQTSYNEHAWRTAVEGIVFGSSATIRWADDVQWFKNERAKLISQWDSAAGNNFGIQRPDLRVVPADEPNLGKAMLNQYDSDVATARRETLATLNDQFNRLWEEFQNRASARGRELRDGPTPTTLTALDRAGYLPLAAPTIFGRTPWAPARPHALLASLIAAGVLPERFASMSLSDVQRAIESDPKLAQALEARNPPLKEGEARKSAGMLEGHFSSMSKEQQTWHALLMPGVIGNLPDAPFVMRATANRIRIVAELGRERDRLNDYQAQDRANEANNGWFGWRSWDDNDMDGKIASSNERIAYYEKLLNDKVPNYGAMPGEPTEVHRKIIYFDPSGDGAIAELHGNINANTMNVGILVPGTGSNLNNFNGDSERAQSFVAQSKDGSLAMIAWLGGDLPNEVSPHKDIGSNAFSSSFTNDLGPKLAGFADDVHQEVDQESKSENNVKVTVAGHSYGGAVVGTAERHGLNADRILHIESAGMGNEVNDPEDYRNPNKNVQRYSMTAPGDPIDLAQGIDFGGLGHGADPDEFPGVTRLHTGNYPDEASVPADKRGKALQGADAHSDVFITRSDAWKNMYEVFTGGEVTIYQEPNDRQIRDGEHYVPRVGPVPKYKTEYYYPKDREPEVRDIP